MKPKRKDAKSKITLTAKSEDTGHRTVVRTAGQQAQGQGSDAKCGFYWVLIYSKHPQRIVTLLAVILLKRLYDVSVYMFVRVRPAGESEQYAMRCRSETESLCNKCVCIQNIRLKDCSNAPLSLLSCRSVLRRKPEAIPECKNRCEYAVMGAMSSLIVSKNIKSI